MRWAPTFWGHSQVFPLLESLGARYRKKLVIFFTAFPFEIWHTTTSIDSYKTQGSLKKVSKYIKAPQRERSLQVGSSSSSAVNKVVRNPLTKEEKFLKYLFQV